MMRSRRHLVVRVSAPLCPALDLLPQTFLLVKRKTLSTHINARRQGKEIRKSPGAPPNLDEANKENLFEDLRSRPQNTPTRKELGPLIAIHSPKGKAPVDRTVRRYVKAAGPKLKITLPPLF